jgi:hypothetical protein
MNSNGLVNGVIGNWAKSSSTAHTRLCPISSIFSDVQNVISYAHSRHVGFARFWLYRMHFINTASFCRTSSELRKWSGFSANRYRASFLGAKPFFSGTAREPTIVSQSRYMDNFLEKIFSVPPCLNITNNHSGLVLCGARINTSPIPLFSSIVEMESVILEISLRPQFLGDAVSACWELSHSS